MKKDVLKLVALAVLLAIVVFTALNAIQYASAEENGYYVICTPEAEINVRESPKLRSGIVACLFFAQRVETDGKEVNGFVHVVNLNADVSDGWVYKGLLVEDQPIPSSGVAQVYNAGRVACRKYANGIVLQWLKDGTNVEVYAISDDWCVTEYGFIKTEFLTLNAKVR